MRGIRPGSIGTDGPMEYEAVNAIEGREIKHGRETIWASKNHVGLSGAHSIGIGRLGTDGDIIDLISVDIAQKPHSNACAVKAVDTFEAKALRPIECEQIDDLGLGRCPLYHSAK